MNISRFTLLLILSISIVSCQSMRKKTENKSSTEGFTPLFDGKTTLGWHTYGKKDAGAAWEVEDGVLRLNTVGKDPADRGDLVTDKEYTGVENFRRGK